MAITYCSNAIPEICYSLFFIYLVSVRKLLFLEMSCLDKLSMIVILYYFHIHAHPEHIRQAQCNTCRRRAPSGFPDTHCLYGMFLADFLKFLFKIWCSFQATDKNAPLGGVDTNSEADPRPASLTAHPEHSRRMGVHGSTGSP